MQNILAIVGSAQHHSSNHKLIAFLQQYFASTITIEIYDSLKQLPHFDPVQSITNPPAIILALREKIIKADAILISSPEYIFSIPSGIKNLLEWSVATTIFSGKPAGIIIASADGKKAFEEMKLIVQTLGAQLTDHTCLLVNGVKSNINHDNEITASLQAQLINLVKQLQQQIYSS